jgi:hypothetical protein
VITDVTQRWRDRRGTYRPAGEVIATRAYEVASIADDRTAKAFRNGERGCENLSPLEEADRRSESVERFQATLRDVLRMSDGAQLRIAADLVERVAAGDDDAGLREIATLIVEGVAARLRRAA